MILSLFMFSCFCNSGNATAAAAASAKVDSAYLQMVTLPSAPTINGVFDESEWSAAMVTDQRFVQIEPEHGVASPYRTVESINRSRFELLRSDPFFGG
jgi:hypothetical protein